MKNFYILFGFIKYLFYTVILKVEKNVLTVYKDYVRIVLAAPVVIGGGNFSYSNDELG